MTANEGDSEISISVNQLPPTPDTDLTLLTVNVNEPETLPVTKLRQRTGATVTVTKEKTVADGAGGTQTAYQGYLHCKGFVYAHFELRNGSNLLAVWNSHHIQGSKNYLQMKQLECVEHYSLGPTREESWEFVEAHRTGDVDVRTIGLDYLTLTDAELQSDELQNITDRMDYTVESCELAFDEIDGTVVWHTFRSFAVPNTVQCLKDAYPIIEAWEENIPERRRNVE